MKDKQIEEAINWLQLKLRENFGDDAQIHIKPDGVSLDDDNGTIIIDDGEPRHLLRELNK